MGAIVYHLLTGSEKLRRSQRKTTLANRVAVKSQKFRIKLGLVRRNGKGPCLKIGFLYSTDLVLLAFRSVL